MNKLSELKDALEFLETTEFDGEWDSALVGGENGKNYHAVINANDVVVRAADDSRHTSWLCDYLEAVSPLNIRALLAELEAKDKRIGELEYELATPKPPEKCPCCNRRYTLESYAHGECAICGEAFDANHALRFMGFTVEGGE
ncbi:hypothetical protein [Serratia marcescens]|uniref:hypothetical protein n=1 Tax=Serratia marcescens TaxID=615 RepID=UPI004045F0C9